MTAWDISGLPAHLKLFAALAEAPEGPPARDIKTVDPAIYVDEGRFRREAALMRRAPVIVAHASEIAAPGSVIAHDHLGAPILLARARDGEIRAFVNACRHRNTKLVKPGEKPRRAAIVCPYHGWTYALDGALEHIPCAEQFPGVATADHGLKRLPCEVRNGLVFVTADGGAGRGVDEQLAGLGADFDAFGLGEAVLFRRTERPIRANWKLVVDAFEDGYHIRHLHRKSIAPFFLENCSIAERVGDNIRSLVARQPFAEARKLPPAEWDIRLHATYSHYVFPNAVLIMHPDYVSLISLFPTAPGETLYSHALLTPFAPETDRDRDHYERSFELIENGVFQAEDIEMCERAQAAIEGGARWPMTLGAYEGGIATFHGILDEALARAPLVGEGGRR